MIGQDVKGLDTDVIGNDAQSVLEYIAINSIKEKIARTFPREKGLYAWKKTTEIMSNYEGVEHAALSLLYLAAVKGKFDEISEKMQKHYDSLLKYMQPETRTNTSAPGTASLNAFLVKTFTEILYKSNQTISPN